MKCQSCKSKDLKGKVIRGVGLKNVCVNCGVIQNDYAVFSEKQRQLQGHSFVYSNSDGLEVICTEISPNKGAPDNAWEDKEDVGEVVSFLRKVG